MKKWAKVVTLRKKRLTICKLLVVSFGDLVSLV